jgi:hypothetical protein
MESVEFSAVASCACCLYTWRSGQQITTWWYTADDYVQRFGHHAIDIRAAVAVSCKIAYCPIEAVKVTQKKITYSEVLLYELIDFFILLLKGQF